MAAIVMALLALEIARAVLDSIETASRNLHLSPSKISYISNFFGNLTIYVGMYASAVAEPNPYYKTAGYALCIFSLIRVLKYRLIDDIYARRLESSGSWLHDGHSNQAKIPQALTILQGVLGVFLRTYFFVATTFAFIYLLLVNNDPKIAAVAFKFENSSGNLYVDFLLYSMFQLALGGYGDIAPRSVAAKLLSMTEMAFGVIILGTVLAMVFGRAITRRPPTVP